MELVYELDPIELQVLATMECCQPDALPASSGKKKSRREKQHRGQRINKSRKAKMRRQRIAEEAMQQTLATVAQVGYNCRAIHNEQLDRRCAKAVRLSNSVHAAARPMLAKQVRSVARRAGKKFTR